MIRVTATAERPTPYVYRDSIHAAVIAALHAAGARSEDLVGTTAKPWTFSPVQSLQAGRILLKGVTISTSDVDLGRFVSRIKSEDILWNSQNGDRIDFGRGLVTSFKNPVPHDGGKMQVYFASPFVVSNRASSEGKKWVEDLKDVNLSEAFSSGLSRRHGRPVDIKVSVDDFTMRVASHRSAIIAVRQSGSRKVTIPGFFLNAEIEGNREDLMAAYFSGLGEKTRYGFGMVAPAK
jgi:CRISPR-associated endoribonuclease Cas6